MNINYQYSNCHNKWWVNIECFHSRGMHICKFVGTRESVCIRKEFNSQGTGLGYQHGRRFIVLGHQYGRRDVMWKHSIRCSFKMTYEVNSLLQKIKLFSFTNLISQKFSVTAVILAFAVSKRCTQDLPVVIRKAWAPDFCFPTIRHSRKKIKKTLEKKSKNSFSVDQLTLGVPFSINFLPSSAFLGFRKEQDAMSSSVSVVRFVDWKISKHVWDLIFLYDNFVYVTFFFSYANLQRSQKRHCYQLHWDTLFQECFWSRSINSRVQFYYMLWQLF